MIILTWVGPYSRSNSSRKTSAICQAEGEAIQGLDYVPEDGLEDRSKFSRLPDIPVIETGPDFVRETLNAHVDRAHRLMDLATKRVPNPILSRLDQVSRAWLERWNNDHLTEIDWVARALDRPGAYFFSVNYEWGCTCRVAPAPDQKSARLVRVLDWRTPGLGRNIIAANVRGRAGAFMTLTWPGYTGVLSANAPGRFSAALNQAPMRKTSGFFVLDWAANRHRVWNNGYATPAHVLRKVFETAPDFRAAKKTLTQTPLSTPAIFLLAGVSADQTAIIERTEHDAHVLDGDQVAANHWQAANWKGRPRGKDSAGRAAQMHRVPADFDPAFSWAKPPILNDRTRLIMVADAAKGALLAQGFEACQPATNVLKVGFA